MLRKAIEEHCFEKRFVDLDAAIVVNEPEPAKSIHEEADARAGGTDHLCQGLLSDGRNELCWFSRFAVFSHQKKESCQALLAGVEELIDEVGLGSYAASQKMR